jgi:hypothetical protein
VLAGGAVWGNGSPGLWKHSGAPTRRGLTDVPAQPAAPRAHGLLLAPQLAVPGRIVWRLQQARRLPLQARALGAFACAGAPRSWQWRRQHR